jgi:ubiquinone/menaquinone biosynthesis C-methylase UbiE
MPRRTRRWIVLAALLAVVLLGWWNRDWIKARVSILLMESGDRVAGLQIDRVLEVLDVGEGMLIADIGAGTGVFARPMARAAAPTGVVYAADVNRELLRHIDRTARARGIENIRTVVAAERDPLLPEPVDLIFLCDTLHHIGSEEEYVKTLRRYLRPGGRVAVIDFREDESPHLRPSMRYSLGELDGWMEEAGYEPDGRHDFVDENFFAVYRCDSCPD